jgi:hypothetical protein
MNSADRTIARPGARKMDMERSSSVSVCTRRKQAELLRVDEPFQQCDGVSFVRNVVQLLSLTWAGEQ